MTAKLRDIRQVEDHDCGHALCCSLLMRWGTIPPDDLLAQIGCTGNGTPPDNIEFWFRREGYGVISGEMAIANLKHFTGLGWPVICLITRNGVGHYVGVTDVYRNKVYYQDPLSGPGEMRAKDFLDVWFDRTRFGQVYTQFGIAIWKDE